MGLGRYAVADPRCAVCRSPRCGGARRTTEPWHYRQPERAGRRKRGAQADPSGYDAGQKVKGRKRHIVLDTLGLLLASLASSIDLFSIWCAILLVIGYSVVGKVSRGKAAGAVIGLWVLWIAIKVGWAAIAG